MTNPVRRSMFLVAALAVGGLTPLAGQWPPTPVFPVPHMSRLFVAPLKMQRDTTTRGDGDYGVTGGLVGGVSVGLAGALIALDVCSTSDTHHGSCAGNALGLGLVGAVVGWVTGSLIGGLIPKGP